MEVKKQIWFQSLAFVCFAAGILFFVYRQSSKETKDKSPVVLSNPNGSSSVYVDTLAHEYVDEKKQKQIDSMERIRAMSSKTMVVREMLPALDPKVLQIYEIEKAVKIVEHNDSLALQPVKYKNKTYFKIIKIKK